MTIEEQVSGLSSELERIEQKMVERERREVRAVASADMLVGRIHDVMRAFDRDAYKSTDNRLRLSSLAQEIRTFNGLGYELCHEASLVLAVSSMLQGLNKDARAYFARFIEGAERKGDLTQTAHYLAGMVCYNRREFSAATEHFSSAHSLSTDEGRDWQALTYVAELQHFMRKPPEVVDKNFFDIEQSLRTQADQLADRHSLWATLYLKWGNCYAATISPPSKENRSENNAKAIELYKEARRHLPLHLSPGSLLPVIIDYSLGMALLLEQSFDMDLAQTPQELLKGVFARLRNIVLTKREGIILAQSYLMLGTCAVFVSEISRELGEIYLEYARHATQEVPSDMSFFSCVTKELLPREEFIPQIDFYASELTA